MKKILLSLFALTLMSLNGHTQTYLNWQRFTDGTAHSDDSAVAIDAEDSNVMVGGNVFNTSTLNDIVIKNYDLNGNLLWTGGYASPLNDHLAYFSCDASSKAMYGTGNSDNGSYLIGLLIKMDMNGKLLWSKNYSSVNGDIEFLNVKAAQNTSKNVIVVGESHEGLLQCDGIVASYDSSGNLLWQGTTSAKSGESMFNNLEVDAAGNIYASGVLYNGVNGDGYVAKYNSTGKLVNSITINGTGNKDDAVKGIELMNNVLYVATVGRGSGLYNEATISAYNAKDFSLIWSKNYSSVNGDIDIAGIIGPEISGNLLLAGEQRNFKSGTSNYLALNYKASDGTLNWAKTATRGKGYNNVATALTVDVSGNLLITGGTNLAGAAVDIFTVAFDNGGNLLWKKIFNDAANGDDYPATIEADENGNFYVAGTSANNAVKQNMDFTLLKYSPELICSVPENLIADSITGTSALLRWDVVPEALKYKLQYRNVGGTWSSLTTNTNNKLITGLNPNTKYQWRVKTVCSNNPAVSSDYSAIQAFYTASSFVAGSSYEQTDASINLKQTGLILFPDPATENVNMQLNDISETNLEVKIYDLSGRVLKQYMFTVTDKAFNRRIDISALTPGSYMIVITGSKEKWSHILIKQ
jgi:hypothetical protein